MNVYNLLKGLLKVAAKTDIRFYLNAVHVTPDELRATDGHMAVIVSYRTGLPADLRDGVLLCRKDLDAKLKMFNAKSEVALTFTGDGKAFLNEYPLATVDGRYPDIKRATNGMREDTASATGLNLKMLATVCATVSTIFAGEGFPVAEVVTVGPTAGVRVTRKNVSAYLMPCRL